MPVRKRPTIKRKPVTILVEQDMLDRIDAYIAKDKDGTRESFVKGALISHIAERELEDAAGD